MSRLPRLFILCLSWLSWPVMGSAQQAVAIYEDDRIERKTVAELLKPGDAAINAAWVWDEQSPPQRFEAKELRAEAITAQLLIKDEKLAVSVQASKRFRLPGAKEHRWEGLRLIAAPTRMWEEVPETLLPSWEVGAGGRVLVPNDSENRWRSRLIGDRFGSWWTDSPAGSKKVGIPLVEATDRSLGLLDAEGQQLNGNLTILLEQREQQLVMAQYRSGETGAIMIPSLPDQRELILLASSLEHTPGGLRAWPSAWPATLRLASGARVSGRTVDPEGEPLQGVEVVAEAWLNPALSVVVGRSAITDAEGRFTLASLPRAEVTLVARRTGYAEWRTQQRIEKALTDLGDLELAPTRSAVLTVVDDLGDPVVGATVQPTNGEPSTTGSRGTTQIEVPPSRALKIIVGAPGHLPSRLGLTWPEDELRVVLPRAFRVEGRFVDAEGTAISEGVVEWQIGRRFRDLPLDGDGRFALDLKPRERVQLTLRSTSTLELKFDLKTGEAGGFRDLGDLAAERGMIVRGRSVRASNGASVPSCRVWTPRAGAQGEVVAWAQGDLLSTVSDSQGRFELRGLSRHSALLRVVCRDLARAHVSIEIPDEGDVVELGDVPLSPGGTVHIVMNEPEELDRAAFTVARVDLLGQWRELDMLTASVIEGEAWVRRVPIGRATITVLQDRQLVCEQEVEVETDEEVLEVECGGEAFDVSGQVFIGDEPAPAGRLSWLSPGPSSPAMILNSSTPLGAKRQQVFGGGRPQVDVEVDNSGFFTTSALTSGSWEVVFAASSGSMTPPQQVELPDVSGQVIELRLPASGIVGFVVDEEDIPVAGARVEEVSSAAFVLSNAEGRFEIQGLSPGAHQLLARHGKRRSEIAEVVIDPVTTADPVTLRLSDHAEDEIEIQVLANESPVSAGFVFVEGDNGSQHLLSIQSDGRTVAQLIPPLPSQLRVAAVASERWAFGPWTDVATARREGLLLVIEATGALEIGSEELEGRLEIASSDGWNVSFLLTRIGAPPALRPGQPLLLAGLPVQRYTVRLGQATVQSEVRRDKTTSLELP